MSIFRRNRKEARLIVAFGVVKFLVCLLAIGRFGFQRDEFLHLALSDHLAWGYLEVPPFISAVSWLGNTVFGDSLFASRLLPSLFGAFTVYLTGLMALSMGGKRFSISVACAGMILSPAFLASGYLLQPVVFDQFFWALSAFLLIQYIKTKKVSYLYWLGATAGLGMLNKYTMLLYVVSLLVGVLCSSQRRLLFNAHLGGAVAVGVLLFLPNFLWQVQHNFPLIRHMKELNKTQLEFISPLRFLEGQLFVHASGILVWLSGFIYLFFSRVRSRYTFISIAYLAVIILLSLLHGKVYYGFGAYPALFAAGGLCWQRVMTRLSAALRYSILTVSLLPCVLFVPVAIPLLSFDSTLRFFSFMAHDLKFTDPMVWEDQKVHATTQDYGDMLGWDEQVALVNTAYNRVPATDRHRVVIIAGNYGRAGAIDHLGKAFGLPKAVSMNSSYKLWAPENLGGDIFILVDDEPDIVPLFRTATRIGEVKNPYAREKGTAVWLLRDAKTDINALYRKKRQAEMASIMSY